MEKNCTRRSCTDGSAVRMHQIEKRLSETFGIERCLIASGDGDRQPKVIAEFGQLLNESLDLLLPEGKNTITDGRDDNGESCRGGQFGNQTS